MYHPNSSLESPNSSYLTILSFDIFFPSNTEIPTMSFPENSVRWIFFLTYEPISVSLISAQILNSIISFLIFLLLFYHCEISAVHNVILKISNL